MLDCLVVSYEILDHTADVRIRVSGDDLAGLLRGAVLGMASLIANTNNIESRESVTVEASGETPEELLVHLLGEALYVHYTRKMIFSDARVEVADDGMLRAKCTLHGEVYDPSRHELGYDMKAVTYHNLKIESTGDRLSAEIVFDV